MPPRPFPAILSLCALFVTAGEAHAVPERAARIVHPTLARLAEPSVESFALNDLNFIHAPQSEIENALRFYIAARDAKRTSGDVAGEARALQGMGVTYQALGENQRALDALRESIPLYRQLGDRRDEAISLHNIAVVLGRLGDTSRAISQFETSLGIFRQLGIRECEASALNNLGQVRLAAGERQTALSNLMRSLEIRRTIRDRRGEAQTLNNIGALYDSIGEQSRALAYYTAALEVRRAAGDHYGEAHALNNIGVVHMSAGRYSSARRRFNQALALLRATADRFAEAGALNNLGAALASAGETKGALDFYTASLKLRRSIGDRRGEGITLYNVALVHLEAGSIAAAIGELGEALAIARQIRDPRGEANALHALALIERDRGNLYGAHALIVEGVNLVESMRDKILSEELRLSFSASEQDVHELYIDILMQLHRCEPTGGFDQKALAASERFRARALLGALSAAGVSLQRPLNAALADRERTARERVGAAADWYIRLLIRGSSRQNLNAALSDLERAKTLYAEAEGEIKSQDGHQPPSELRTVSADDIRQDLLGHDAVLLEYALGEERSYLWVITRERTASFELPPRRVIEAGVQRLYRLLTARSRHERFETAEEKVSRVRAADAEYWRAAKRLSTILLRPAGSALNAERFLIVPDGALFSLPFSALPDPRRRANSSPLIIDHEIVVLPSASALAALRGEIAGRAPASKLLVVIADPVYSPEDPRLATGHRDIPTQATNFPRLTFARDEAKAILALAPVAARRGALDFDASRAKLLPDILQQYRYIHFATHAYVDREHPEVSGMVLSLVDSKGRENEGLLRLYDVLNLKLAADLVVLSACRTGLGREVRGEGVVGLARGFLHVGAARVVVSLWDVNDRATAELMKEFYRRVLGNELLSPAAALRASQLAMWRNPRWSAPYYWASFFISGEPR